MTFLQLQRLPKQTPARIAYRFFAGRPLDGHPRTDATYTRPATRALTPTGRASRWAMLPGWKRQAWRLGPPATVTAVATAQHVAPVYTTASLALLGTLSAGYGIRRGYRGVVMRRFNATYIRPTRLTLMAGLGSPVELHVDPTLGNLVPRLATPLSPRGQGAGLVRGACGTRDQVAARPHPTRDVGSPEGHRAATRVLPPPGR